jgi:uncharacterized protein (UPF0216 family)
MNAFEAMFGVAPRLKRFLEDEFKESSPEEALKEHYMRRKDLNLLIAEKLNQYEAERAGLKIGSLVLVRNFKRRKFDPRWIGPAVVTAVKQHSVKVTQENGKTRTLNRVIKRRLWKMNRHEPWRKMDRHETCRMIDTQE